MKKVLISFGCILLASVIVFGFVTLVIRDNESDDYGSGIFGGILGGNESDTSDSGGSDIDTDDSEADTDNSSETEDNIQYAARLGEGSLDSLVYVTDGKEARIGFQIEGLKAHTDYLMKWDIDQNFMIDTTALFVVDIVDGVARHEVYFDSSYVPDEGLGQIYTGPLSSLLSGHDGIGLEVRTESDSDTCVFFIFSSKYESPEQMAQLCKILYTYVNELTFEEFVPADDIIESGDKTDDLDQDSLNSIYASWAYHEYGSQIRIGLVFENLEPNSQYKITWRINPEFVDDTNVRFQYVVSDGVYKPCVKFYRNYNVDKINATYFNVYHDFNAACNGDITVEIRDVTDKNFFVFFVSPNTHSDNYFDLINYLKDYLTFTVSKVV